MNEAKIGVLLKDAIKHEGGRPTKSSHSDLTVLGITKIQNLEKKLKRIAPEEEELEIRVIIGVDIVDGIKVPTRYETVTIKTPAKDHNNRR